MVFFYGKSYSSADFFPVRLCVTMQCFNMVITFDCAFPVIYLILIRVGLACLVALKI